MSGTLQLAASISAMDLGQVERLLEARQPSPNAVDPLGLASELLRTDSISRAVSRLPREQLRALSRLREGAQDPSASDSSGAGQDPDLVRSLKHLGLAGVEHGETVPLPEVTAVLEAMLDARSIALAPGDTVSAPDGGTPDTSHWFAPALTAITQVAECVRALLRTPGKLNRNGSIAVLSVRALAEVCRVTERESALAVEILNGAGFLSLRDRVFSPSTEGLHWIELPHTERWLRLASRTLEAMPAPLRDSLHDAGSCTAPRSGETGEHPGGSTSMGDAVAALPERYPLLPETEIQAARDYLPITEHLGLTVSGHLTKPALALLAGAWSDAHALAASAMPGTAAGIYIQPDLSVVIPGPLAPHDEALLASLSEPEQLGVASTRRITEATLHAAFERGLSPEDAATTLSRLSLTGVPQPLEYLLTATAERFGTIVVEEHHGQDARTRITVARPALADTLLVDRALQHLQLHRVSDTEMLARLRTDHVLAALSDARHTATLAASSASGETAGSTAPTRSSALAADAGPAPDPDPGADPEASAQRDLATQAARIVQAARAEPSDYTRRIELAIRDRTGITVTVNAGAGSTRQFTVMPMSLDAGRLRALDEAAGVERTLPVNLITAVD